MNKNFDETFAEFFKLLRERDEKHMQEKFPTLDIDVWDVKFGRRFVKVIRGSSVYAFVELSSGDIYMPASWRAPAKHVRGNIFGDNPLAGTGIYGVDYLK